MDSVETDCAMAAQPRSVSLEPGEPTGDVVGSASTGGTACDRVLQTRFGAVPLDADRQIRFRGGLPGFPDAEWFQLDPIPGLVSDLMILQAIDATGIGFITMPLPDDNRVLRDSDLADVSRMLDIAPGERLILAIVTLASGRDGIEKYLNLRAPLFIDTRRKVGAQVVLADPTYPLRYRFETTTA